MLIIFLYPDKSFNQNPEIRLFLSLLKSSLQDNQFA
jgi:hypothetical protein